jgi:formylglycine-generating enzyme required for sulfatase activity/energy-coupling factor transporter ATP-binding protein EcfA2
MTPRAQIDRLAAALLAALLLLVALTAPPAGAQQPLPTATALPATPAPTAAPVQPGPTPAPPAQTATPPLTPTVAPTPEPTLTVPQALDRIISGEKPVETFFTLLAQRPPLLIAGLFIFALLIAGVVAAVKPWRERFFRWLDRRTGGQRRDLEDEVQREEAKKELVAAREATRTQQQARSAHDVYLSRLERDMLRLAKIPALGREQRELDLEQVYVPLHVVEREQMESFDTYILGKFGAEDGGSARQDAYQAVQESRPVFRLLSEPKQLPPPEPEANERRRARKPAAGPETTTERLLLVGRAGSGKTTTLHYGALILARAARTANTAEVRKELQLFAAKPLFPIYARLTEVMTYVHEQYAQRRAELVGAPAQLLLDAIDELARRDVPDLPAGMIKSQIKDGGCLIMLDGLDETGDADERGSAMDLIASLVRECAQNRYLVASRPFEGLGDRLPRFVERHLRPLDANDIRRLLNKLFLALRLPEDGTASPSDDPHALVPEAAELWRNLERNPRLFDMATNPLLLTSMAVLVEGREPLPVERAKIYEKLVRLTIEAWRKAQLSRDRPAIPVKLFEESDDSVRLRLQLLAAAMLKDERREISLAQARDLLRPVYEANNPGWNNERCNDYVRELLYQIALHSGLLQARDSDSLFSFAHFTLQEYLAARHYTEQRSGKDTTVQTLVMHWPESRWRETILLAIGHEATSGSREMAQTMLKTLLAVGDPEALLLASDGLDEANARAVGELTPQRLEVSGRLRALAALTDDWRTAAHPDPVLRNRAATMLDRLDADTERPGLDLAKEDYWATRIEPGTFSMGDEKNKFDYTIRQPYTLARFPVTNRQYLLFVEALAGRGTAEAVAAARKLLPLMAQHKQTVEEFRPRYWLGARFRAGEGNHPVVGVTWYAATAFAWWANETFLTPEQRAAGEAIRLPTEAEWERAAAYPPALPGGNTRAGRREYPWGAELTAAASGSITASIQANIGESKIGGTSVVGIFPHGTAACGAEELSGNVWEWCSTPKLDYPFKGEVSAESLYSVNKRASSIYVLRGGSWHDNRVYARCAVRLDCQPRHRHLRFPSRPFVLLFFVLMSF